MMITIMDDDNDGDNDDNDDNDDNNDDDNDNKIITLLKIVNINVNNTITLPICKFFYIKYNQKISIVIKYIPVLFFFLLLRILL